MSSFCCVGIASLSAIFGSAPLNSNTQALISDEVVIYEGRFVKLIIPERSLDRGSVKVVANSSEESFSKWTEDEELESFQLIQRVVQIWQEKGITDYLRYGKESSESNSVFGWEIVPYSKNAWSYWQQFKVLWHTAFGGLYLSRAERLKITEDFQKDKELFSEPQIRQIKSIQEIVKGNDAFCNKQVIDRQVVFEGKEVRILYNYAPIVLGAGKLHFLVVPKQHRSGFSDLTETEYLEAMQLSQKLVHFYGNKGYHTAYLFDKTGARAGQSVPHWHEHVVFTATKAQEWFGRLSIFKNMLFGSSPLPEKELKSRVEALRTDLAEALQ